MKKLSLIFVLALMLASSAFAEKDKFKNEKYHAVCQNGELVVYDENENISFMPTTNYNVDTTKQSVKEFNKTLFKCGKKLNKERKQMENSQKSPKHKNK